MINNTARSIYALLVFRIGNNALLYLLNSVHEYCVLNSGCSGYFYLLLITFTLYLHGDKLLDLGKLNQEAADSSRSCQGEQFQAQVMRWEEAANEILAHKMQGIKFD